MDVPMLDENEFRIAYKLYEDGMKDVNTADKQKRYGKLLAYYNELTGMKETEPNAIMHHRIALYGPLCKNCGKPYRTPTEEYCAACGDGKNRRNETSR